MSMDPESFAKFREFSEPAQSTVRRWVISYMSKLIDASFTAKQNVDGDNVSEANVNEAAYSLNRKEGKRLTKVAGIVGGLFVGTGLSTLVSVIQAGKFDRNGTIVIGVTGILGSFLIALDLPQGILPRWRKSKSYSSTSQPFKVKRRSANPSPRTSNQAEPEPNKSRK
jgi:hypothetical protein